MGKKEQVPYLTVARAGLAFLPSPVALLLERENEQECLSPPAKQKDVANRKLRRSSFYYAYPHATTAYGAEAVGARRVRAPPSTPAHPPARPPPSGPGPPLSLLRSPAPHRQRARIV